MRIGITYDLKLDVPVRTDAPDDLQEEFDSPATIESIAAVLRDLGHEVVKLGDGRALLKKLLADPPDFVFNFAEGEGIGRAREARVPGVLEMLGIPYTGSDPLTLAVTLDKECAKRLAASYGVQVPRGEVILSDEPASKAESLSPSLFPVIVKPAWEGSSKGIRKGCFVDKPAKLSAVIEEMRRCYQQPILVEEFIDGAELTVGILGDDRPQILGIMRVSPVQPTKHFVYSLEIKRDFERLVHYECPAKLPAPTTEAIRCAALKVYRGLGCRDVSRMDFRLRDGVPYFLEVNPLPGLNPQSSDLVIMSRLIGWSYPQLIGTILQSAIERHNRKEEKTQKSKMLLVT